MATYLLRCGLNEVLVDIRRRLRDRSREPPKALGQRRQRVLLQLLKLGQALLLLRNRRAAKPGVLAPLVWVQIVRPRRIRSAQALKVLVIDLDLATRHTSRRLVLRPRSSRRRPRPTLPQRHRTSFGHSHAGLALAWHVLPPLDLGTQPLLPLLAGVAAVPLRNSCVVPAEAAQLRVGVGVEEGLPVVVAAVAHALDLGLLEGVHGDRAHKGDVYAQAAVDAGAGQANEYAKFRGGPLRGGRVAVAAEGVARFFLDCEELEGQGKSGTVS